MPLENSQATAYICRIILEQIKILQKEASNIRTGNDPEYVHQCRVASRRLRAALAIFSPWFPASDIKKWNKLSKKITGALGIARDIDVQIIFLQEWIISHPTPGAKRFLLRLFQKRVNCNYEIEKIAGEIENGSSFLSLTDKISSYHTISSFSEISGNIDVDNIIKPVLINLTHQLLSKENHINDNPDVNNQYPHLHEMRINAKKLRYALTLINEIYQNLFASEIKIVKNIQELLGDLHDCDVWIAELPKFLIEEKNLMMNYAGNTRGYKRLTIGINEILTDRINYRAEIIKDFRKYWKEQKDKNIWKELIVKINNATALTGTYND